MNFRHNNYSVTKFSTLAESAVFKQEGNSYVVLKLGWSLVLVSVLAFIFRFF